MEGQFSIRAFRPDDLEAVAALEYGAFETNAYPGFFFRQAYDVFGELLRVAVTADERIAGYILGGMQPGGTTGWILSIAVRKEYRRRGMGKKLMGEVIGLMRKRGVERIALTVEPENTDAVEAYRRMGFETTGTEQDYFGEGEPRTTMIMELSRTIE